MRFMTFLGRKTVKAEKTSAPKASKAPKAAKTSSAPTSSAPTKRAPTKRAPTHEEIAARSYELYLARGAEPGHAEEDWMQAEAELS
jgi:hypothetical protein